jgi:hypothetical protein
LCALALATILPSGCSDSGSMTGVKPGSGRVRMVLGGSAAQAATVGKAGRSVPTTWSDSTGRQITSATISLSAVEARNIDGQLIPVTMDLPMSVDLVALINGGTVDLPDGSLPAGTYDQFVIVIRSLHVELSDGTQVDVTPPGGGWTAIVPTDPFDVVAGQVTTAHLSFRADSAFNWINGQLEFDPEFDCNVDHHHSGGDDQGGDD